jgi:metal-responsive CopG/Arc/MetJ family transcriptional regulator
MKTAVSIPDSLYNEAERLAKGLRLSRSRLYARALERFIRESATRHVTAALDEVYGKGQEADAFVDSAARRALEDEDW